MTPALPQPARSILADFDETVKAIREHIQTPGRSGEAGLKVHFVDGAPRKVLRIIQDEKANGGKKDLQTT